MKATIRRIGNSQGIILPKPLLAQIGAAEELDVTVDRNSIVLRKSVRSGWAEASQQIAEAHDDALVWPEFANLDDSSLIW